MYVKWGRAYFRTSWNPETQAVAQRERLKLVSVLMPLTLIAWMSCKSRALHHRAKHTYRAQELEELEENPGKAEQ